MPIFIPRPMTMTTTAPSLAVAGPLAGTGGRLDYLDATRAFALILGIVFHAALSFLPIFIGWAVQDVSTGILPGIFAMISHSFRMETFFLLAGFFSRLTFHRHGTGDFIRSRLLRIGVPFLIGWFLLRPLLVSGFVMGGASLRGSVDVWAGLREGFQSLSTLPAGIFTGTHLWFLYYLALITALALLAHGLLSAAAPGKAFLLRRGDALVAWLAKTPLGIPLLALPTAAALWFMQAWGMDTPDRSLAPHLPVLAIYGGFFLFGWMLSRQRELIVAFARLTPLRWILAGLASAAVLWLSGFERDPSHRHYFAAHVAYALAYALLMWSLVALTIGIFHKLCPRPNASVRYIADSSYWMYLLHLPVVIWLQVAVAEWPLHWSLKLPLISAATIALCLLTYDLFVRSTFIGRILNGRPRERVILPWIARRLSRTSN